MAARQAGDLLEHLAEVPLEGKQLVDLCADALGWVMLVQSRV
jgi:hypothetical protein